MLFVKPQDVSGSLDIVDDQRLLVLFGKQNMFFEKFDLKVVGIFMETVKTRLPDGNNFVFLKIFFQ